MKRKLLTCLSVVVLATLGLIVCKKSLQNNPPDCPSRPVGPSSARIGYPSVFSTFTSDPDGDSIAYRFYWGDGDTTSWSRYLPGDSVFAMSHGWDSSGGFQVRAQATDRAGAISDWSEPTLVSVAGTREVKWRWED